MKDSLKEFVGKNRKAFDEQLPTQLAWRNIEKSLFGNPLLVWNSVSVWRAAAIVLVGITLLLTIKETHLLPKDKMADIKGDFGDVEVFYSDQILQKKELVNQYQLQTGLTEDEVTQNIQKLEAMYLMLKEEMQKHPSQDVKDALVLNLLVRIDLLNQQLNNLDKANSKLGKVSANI